MTIVFRIPDFRGGWAVPLFTSGDKAHFYIPEPLNPNYLRSRCGLITTRWGFCDAGDFDKCKKCNK